MTDTDPTATLPPAPGLRRRSNRAIRRRAASLALVTVSALVASACGVAYEPPGEVALPPAVTPSTAATATVEACDNDDPALPAVSSYAPADELPTPGEMPAGSYMAEIQQRGRLVVGTSIDTNLFASLDPSTNQIEGFDVDVAKLVALAIFGGSWDDVDEHIELRGITFAQRIPLVTSGEVDLVAHTMTVNCERWQQVAFSGIYFNAGQKLLVASDSAITSIDDLTSETVCVSAGGTSAADMKALLPDVALVEVDNQTDCMVMFQRGEVQVIRSDDAILAGFAAQDPFARVVDMAPLSEEPYGMAMNLEQPEFARFVNAVLEQAKASDDPATGWSAIYDRWLRPALGEPVIPVGVYDRPLPG